MSLPWTMPHSANAGQRERPQLVLDGWPSEVQRLPDFRGLVLAYSREKR